MQGVVGRGQPGPGALGTIGGSSVIYCSLVMYFMLSCFGVVLCCPASLCCALLCSVRRCVYCFAVFLLVLVVLISFALCCFC